MARRPSFGLLLQTKFAVPRGPKPAVPRPRLLDMLDVGAQGALTLLAAPAGAGKSALVSEWIAAGRAPGPVAWLSLDGDDADRRRFWRAILEALKRATGDEAIAALAVSPREPLDVQALLAALVDALGERDEPVVLVLDDFHEVADAVHQDLERLVRFPPPALRLVVVARADPPIALGRLRLDRRLTDIRAAQLAFTPDEAAALFDALGVTLAPDDLGLLWRRTEGWAAGLRLAGLSLLHHANARDFIEHFAGTDAAVSEYLVSEVLAHQPPELREFLLRTSIVDLINPDLANALTGRADSHELLIRLEHGGALMTPLDEHGAWHRYHPLFAELLRADLRAERPDELRELHARAAAWLAVNGEDAAALRHAAAGHAWDLARELTIDRWVHLLIEGELGALAPVLDAMPVELVEDSPELALAFGGAMLARGEDAPAQRHIRCAHQLEHLVAPERRAQFAASVAAVALYEGRLRGDLESALAATRRLLASDPVLDGANVSGGLRVFVLTQLGIVELWSGDIDLAADHLSRAHAGALHRGNDWTALAAGGHLAMARLFRGEVGRALRLAEDAAGLAQRRGWARAEPAGAAYSVQAAIAIQRGHPGAAADLVERAGKALRDTRDRPLRCVHALNRALLAADGGDPEGALGILQVARDDVGDWPLIAPLEDILVAQEGLLRAAVGERGAARALLEGHKRDAAHSIPVANALARLRLQDSDPAAAREALGAHLDGANGAQAGAIPLAVRAEVWLLDAMALDAMAEHDGAARSLERSLDLAEPAGMLRPIVTHGASLRPLLHRQLRRGTAHPAMVGEALEAIERRGAARRAPSLLAEPLSEREQAILQYLPTMMSNQEIAGELFVSVNTVKTHLRAIYRKLDAPGRREAVRRARDLGLMP